MTIAAPRLSPLPLPAQLQLTRPAARPGVSADGAPAGPRELPARRRAPRRRELLVDVRGLARDVGPVEAQHVLGGLGHEALAQLLAGQQLVRHPLQRAR